MAKRQITDLILDKVAAVDSPCQEGAKAVIMKRNDPAAKAADNAGLPVQQPSEKESVMTLEEMKKQLGDLETQVQTLTASLGEATGATVAITAAAEAAGFTVEAGAEGVVVAKAADPEYIDFGGERVLKSAVPAPLLKAMEKAAARVDALEKAADSDRIAKASEIAMPHIGGSAETKSAVYKALDGIADEATRKAAFELLKGADSAVAMQTAERGATPHEDESSATYRLNKMATDYAAANSTTFQQAFSTVTERGDGAALMRKSRQEQRSGNA